MESSITLRGHRKDFNEPRFSTVRPPYYLEFEYLKHEQKRPHVSSAIKCYMKEHGVSRKEACSKFQEMIAIAWKDMNHFCLKPTPFPMSLLMRVINLARFMEVLYQYEDGYTHSSGETKKKIQAVVVDPVVI